MRDLDYRQEDEYTEVDEQPAEDLENWRNNLCESQQICFVCPKCRQFHTTEVLVLENDHVVVMCDGMPAREKVRVPRHIILDPSARGNGLSPEDDDDDIENRRMSASARSHRNRANRQRPFYLRPGSSGDMRQSSGTIRQRQIQSSSDPFQRYVSALGRKQLYIKSIEGDGNCMFRSISHQLYGEERFHDIVRQACMDYMEGESQYFSHFVVGGIAHFKEYIRFKRMNGVWGDDPEIQAICELYDRPVEIWVSDPENGAQKLRTFHEARVGNRPSLRLSYYGGGHYDSVVHRSLAYHEQCAVIPERPGVVEERAIAKAQRQCLEQSESKLDLKSAASGFEEADLKDILKTSRKEFDAQRMDLEKQFQEAQKVSLSQWQDEMEKKDIERATKTSEEALMSRITQETQYPSEVQAQITTDSQELARAVKISQDHLENQSQKALEDALEMSKKEHGSTGQLDAGKQFEDDPELAAAMAASMGVSTDMYMAGASAASQLDDDEDLLMMAIAASMEN